MTSWRYPPAEASLDGPAHQRWEKFKAKELGNGDGHRLIPRGPKARPKESTAMAADISLPPEQGFAKGIWNR